MIDVSTIPFAVTAGTEGFPVDLGGLFDVGVAIDPFVMEYGDGLPAGWGQLTADGVSQTSRIYGLILGLQFRAPYLNRVQSSQRGLARRSIHGSVSHRECDDGHAGNSVHEGRRFDRFGRQYLRGRRPVPYRLASAGIPAELL
jgi:hypothetical protein